ncbi:hypothetical protein H4J45_09700 [Colwellia sp. BRX10-6]|uniref:hypothetical protein n=1 Tax=unclassified Colwellia TaxID=196834 RepID=UPI0015F767C3|nr:MULTISPECIES: hypothetical protein [unclassified Colwellia]MBA6383647.1 hypothetical protein [Colwellia sp. BRX10-9]MBA6394357.1 hypothetical protein [Colwellia sp. BRX10-6]
MSYYDLPTKRKQFGVTLGTLIVYAIIFIITDTLFPEIDADIKKKLSQLGLFTIFISGLLASLGYLWASKVQHNKDIAEIEIAKHEENLEILQVKLSGNPSNLAPVIKDNQEKLENAKNKLMEVNKHPDFLLFSGKFSLAVLALGTLLCIIGEG